MNNFGEFLYKLRKEKQMTQAELADALGVTNKAVSKWETGEAMPETSLLLPISRIFGVTVDELLNGARSRKQLGADETFNVDEIKKHIFTRGKDDGEKTLTEKICGAVCGSLCFAGLVAYLMLGALAGLWHPYWIIVPVSALACGWVGIIFDLCNSEKRAMRRENGENPFAGGICGLIILGCIMGYLIASAVTGLWHTLWIIIVFGVAACFLVGIAGNFFGK